MSTIAPASADLLPGFTDRVLSAQMTFRAVMDAMARPGRIQTIAAPVQGPPPLSSASAALVLTLLDQDTPLWLDPVMAARADVARWIVFHAGAPMIRDPAQASFALIGDAVSLTSFELFAQGTPDYPDRSTTLLIQLESLTTGPAFTLKGPGIDGVATLNAPLPTAFVAARAANHAQFPCGVDCILAAGDTIIALPRTTQLLATGG